MLYPLLFLERQLKMPGRQNGMWDHFLAALIVTLIHSGYFSTAVEQLRKPIIIEKLKNTECKKGEKAVLKAVITGDPVPDIKW